MTFGRSRRFGQAHRTSAERSAEVRPNVICYDGRFDWRMHWDWAALIDSIFNRFTICRMHSFVVCFFGTSNMTDRHRGPKQTLRAQYRAPSRHGRDMCRHSYFCLLDVPSLCNAVIFFIGECGIARFLCAMCELCLYLKFGQYPYPLSYVCAKFRFCRTLHCWVSPRRKWHTESLSHSLTQLI